MMRWFFTPWSLIGSLIFAIFLLAATLALIWFTRPGPQVNEPATAVLNVIAAPTATEPSPTATPPEPVTPTAPEPPSPAPGVILVGAYVQIAGTGGAGLRLRSDAGLEGQVRLLGAEAEVFMVSDGPREVDGYTWWYLVGPYDETRRGWAVSNYLEVVQNP